jgi:hypothetical protein
MRLNGWRVSSNASDTESPGLSRAANALKKQGYAVEPVDWNDTTVIMARAAGVHSLSPNWVFKSPQVRPADTIASAHSSWI